MAILVAEAEFEELEAQFVPDAAEVDFGYPEHAPQWRWPGVCGICGKLHPSFALPPEPVNDLGGQPEAPMFGADEYLSW